MYIRRFLIALAARHFSGPLGLDLNTVREPLASRPEETFSRLAELGITELEVRPMNLVAHATLIRGARLRPVHLVIDSSVITDGNSHELHPRLNDLIVMARKYRVRRLGMSYVKPGARGNSIARLNEAAEACRSAGKGFYYHNHACEFDGAPGERFIDRLHAELHPEAKLELDVFGVALAGEDPVALLQRWGGRVGSLYMKNVAASVSAGVKPLDWHSILAAARDANVEHYLIEHDPSLGDPLEGVRSSIAYLRGLVT